MEDITMANLPIIKLVKEKTAVYYDGRRAIKNPDLLHELGKRVLSEYIEEDREAFAVVLLDAKLKPIGHYIVSTGTLNQSLVHPREVYKKAIIASANSVVLLHNHPSGDSYPSREDIQVTQILKEAGELIGIQVLDHLIVGDDNYHSFKEEGDL